MKPACWHFGGAMILAALLLACAPAMGIENGLLGIQIGATPQDLLRTYGPPGGIVISGPGGLTLNTLRTKDEEMQARLGLIGPIAPAAPPDWARAVLPSSLAADQQMWLYRLKGEVTAGFIIKGNGNDAFTTDIIAASGKPNRSVETERGIHLGDKFSEILISYGYPPLIQPYAGQAQGAPRAAAAAGTLRGAGMPTFGRMGRSGGPMGAGAMARGAGPVPTLGAAVAPAAGGSQVVVISQQPITFTKHCVIIYDGMVFTLHNFRVVRIQVTE